MSSFSDIGKKVKKNCFFFKKVLAFKAFSDEYLFIGLFVFRGKVYGYRSSRVRLNV